MHIAGSLVVHCEEPLEPAEARAAPAGVRAVTRADARRAAERAGRKLLRQHQWHTPWCYAKGPPSTAAAGVTAADMAGEEHGARSAALDPRGRQELAAAAPTPAQGEHP